MLVDLDSRTSNGISVAILWDDSTRCDTFIELETADEWHRFKVAPEAANDAFLHPFVYLTLAMHPAYPYAGEVISESVISESKS